MSDDFEKRARAAYGDYPADYNMSQDDFVAGAKWARAEMQDDLILGNNGHVLNIQIAQYRKTIELQGAEVDRLTAIIGQDRMDDWRRIQDAERELAAANAELSKINLANRLPPRPMCPDCGVESLTGNVHDETCFKWLELKDLAESDRSTALKLEAALKLVVLQFEDMQDSNDIRENWHHIARQALLEARAALEGKKK